MPKTRRKPGAPSVEQHPQFDEILKAMMGGQKDTEIRKWMWPKLDVMALSRFRRFRMQKVIAGMSTVPSAMAMALQKKGLLPDTEEVAQIVAATAAVMADPLVDRIKKHQELIDEQLQKPKLTAGGASMLINTDLRGIELYAKLTNRLQAPSSGVSITIVNPQPTKKGDILSPIIDIGIGN